MTYNDTVPKGQAGFSLIEILAAMFLLCIGLLALFSTFGSTILSNANAAERADAVRIAQEQIEAAKGMYFSNINSKPEQFDRNGIVYTCQITVHENQTSDDLKDIAVTVSWMSRHASGSVAEQVQLATTVLRGDINENL